MTIKTLPTNATLYYNGIAVTAGQVIPNFDNTLLTVDPIDGNQIVVFDYSTTDADGVESDPATVTMPFTGLTISGNVFNDGNGDDNVNGTAISSPDGTQLYATLLADDNTTVLATVAIESNGTYSFDGTDGVTANTNYTVVLATTPNAITSDLPENWNNTGENINSDGNGNDGTDDGVISVSLSTNDVPEIDFGINKKPVAVDTNETLQLNPSGNTQYQVPALNIADNEDGQPMTVTITTLPDPDSMGVLYYNGVPVVEGEPIPNFNPSLLTVDPVNGNPVVTFEYTTTDADGVESDPATVTMPFKGDIYVGNRVWMDENGNGVQDDGEANKAGVTVKLYAEDGTLIATAVTDENGEYVFKVAEPGNYYIEFDNSYSYTNPCDVCEDDVDSDVNKTTNRTALFSLDYGDNDMTHDAGIAPTAHIGDYFWIDHNKNGIQDDGEEPVAGATVELFDANGDPVTDANGNHSVVTDANGRYGFDVEPGEYQVRFTLPPTGYEGYVFSSENQGDDGLDTDVNGKGFTQTITAVAGENNLSLDAGINCGCENVSSDGSDTLGLLGMLAMMLMTLLTALFFVRKEEEQRV